MSLQLSRVRDLDLERLIKPAAVVAILVVAAYLGRRASVSQLILFAAAGGGLILLHTPELGLLALPVSALVVPFAIGTGTQTSINLLLLIIPALLIVWLANMFRVRALRLVPSPVNLPAILFATSATISFLAGHLVWNYFAKTASMQAQLGELAVYIFSPVLLLLVGNLVKDRKWLEWITWSFLVLGGIYIFSRIVPGLGLITARYSEGSTGSLFWVWLVALAAGQFLFNRSLARRWRLLLAGVAAATLYTGFVNRSWESGWIPPAVTLLALLWLYSWRLGLLATIAGAITVLFLRPDLIASILSVEDYSLSTRFMAWRIVLGDILPMNPVLGLGPANYYFYTPLFPISGYYVQFNSHNQYVDMLAQVGIVGLALFVWLMAAIGRVGWRVRGQVQTGFSRAYVNACLAGLVGTLAAGMLGDWFLPFVYNIGLTGYRAAVLGWLFLGGLVAIYSMAKDEPAST